MVYPALLPLMRTPRLPVVDWTDAPADLYGLVRFAERRNPVSARVPSHFNWPLQGKKMDKGEEESHASFHSCFLYYAVMKHNFCAPRMADQRSDVNSLVGLCCQKLSTLIMVAQISPNKSLTSMLSNSAWPVWWQPPQNPANPAYSKQSH